ncbi:hypothetical protein SLW73_14235 [Glutamicibacter protophormiae]|uniref:hypothetical protein n=1 Tax=Glutamicibacter protophormiae TaxID=37930 RepID=UPI002A7EF7B6|nr:hypothetical protein [Glutamicibacter protophormiae]WPR64031.1 hypothetical protein SLW72_14245 [Glutamicibacter protophormiae]WPR67525.1 hypothetical protein SLW73_14235 [Glutamicibacter protophormiae]
MASHHTFIVTISETYISNMPAAVTQLESHGLEVQQVLGMLGQVIGQAPDERVKELKNLDCVKSVDSERRYKAL